LIDKVLKTIKKYCMVEKGDKVIVAVSGGPDSMCLLHILYKLKDLLGIQIVVAHVNHGLRGEEALKDQVFVEDFCNEYAIKYYSINLDINSISIENNLSIETAARNERYKYFSELKNHIGANKVALAHNANDQAETVIMRLFRGTGLEGLGGIKPVRDKIYIRPLLFIERYEIEKYLKESLINFRIDESNNEDIYTRNKIRLQLIPVLKTYNSNIISSLNTMAEGFREDSQYFEEISLEKYSKYVYEKEDKVIILKGAFLERKPIISRIIRLAITRLSGNIINIERVHIENILDIQKPPTGRKTLVTNNIKVINNYGDLSLSLKEEDINIYKSEVNLNLGYNSTNNINIRILKEKENFNFHGDILTQYFDYDKIHGAIIMRFRKDGDRFTPLGMEGSKKIKDYFIDLKVQREERDKVPLICFGDKIAWIVGYGIGNTFKVSSKTSNILEIKFEGEENK